LCATLVFEISANLPKPEGLRIHKMRKRLSEINEGHFIDELRDFENGGILSIVSIVQFLKE